jgi:hypothetical protein
MDYPFVSAQYGRQMLFSSRVTNNNVLQGDSFAGHFSGNAPGSQKQPLSPF